MKRHALKVISLLLLLGLCLAAVKIWDLQKRIGYNEQRDKCAKQAHEQYKNYGWDKEKSANVTNHYNKKLNVCFMLIENNEVSTLTITLIDAFEGKTYGSYLWMMSPTKKYWEQSPIDCSVKLLSGEKKICKSSDDFDELIKPYMEE